MLKAHTRLFWQKGGLQVDVILSVVSNEMRPTGPRFCVSLHEFGWKHCRIMLQGIYRSVRSEFDKKLNAALLHNIETDDQVRRLHTLAHALSSCPFWCRRELVLCQTPWAVGNGSRMCCASTVRISFHL